MKTWTTSLAARQYACNALPCLGSCFVHFFLLLFLVWAKWKCLSVRSKYLMAIWRVAAIELAAASVLATAAAVAVSVCSLFAVSLKCTQFFSWHLGSTCNNNNCLTLRRNWHRRWRLPLVCLLFVLCIFLEEPCNFSVERFSFFFVICFAFASLCLLFSAASLLVCPAIFQFFTFAFLLSLWHGLQLRALLPKIAIVIESSEPLPHLYNSCISVSTLIWISVKNCLSFEV